MKFNGQKSALGAFLALVVLGDTLVGCTRYQGREALAEHPADIANRRQSSLPQYHTIARGETLFSIAWRYGIDYRQIAALNGLYEPYTIYAGRRLLMRQLQRSDVTAADGRRRARGSERERPPRADDDGDTADSAGATGNRTTVPAGSRRVASGVDWHWPVRGQVSSPAPDSDKVGLEIRGPEGTIVRAAAPGEVVYSGDRLIGYGKLIIIRHNDAFLSAYGHNRRLMVTEGLKVAAGQEIAEMGSSGTDQSKLYFEIRRHGKPVPPLDYLP